MTRTHRTFVMAALLAGAASITGLADAPLRVQVSPSFGLAPALLKIQATIEPADDNRTLDVVADSGTYYRSTRIELSGAGAARAHVVEFRAVPEGVYEVQVVLRGGDSRARATLYHRVVLIGRSDM
jgi:hypothetical protein